MSLLDDIEAVEDVAEETITVPMWGDMEILFRGLSYASLGALRGIDLAAAKEGDLDSAIKILQATAHDPADRTLLFASERGERVLRSKGYEAILYMIEHGSLVVLGVDEKETAGKDSSSTETEVLANA